MIIQKFGGTSVGDVKSFKQVTEIVTSTDEKRIVVLSALSGVTDGLLALSELMKHGKKNKIFELTEVLRKRFKDFVNKLFDETRFLIRAQVIIDSYFTEIIKLSNREYCKVNSKRLHSYGELITSEIFQLYLEKKKLNRHYYQLLTS